MKAKARGVGEHIRMVGMIWFASQWDVLTGLHRRTVFTQPFTPFILTCIVHPKTAPLLTRPEMDFVDAILDPTFIYSRNMNVYYVKYDNDYQCLR